MMLVYARKSFKANWVRMFSHHQKPDEHLKTVGIKNQNIIRNPSVAEIYEHAMLPRLRKSCDIRVRDSCLSSTGALVAYSGKGTGRSPKDKRVVLDETTKDKRVIKNLRKLHISIIGGFASFDPNNRFTVRVLCNRPYHALFMKQMLIRPSPDEIDSAFSKGADFTIINGGEFPADPNNDSVTGETSVAVNLKKGEMAILGTQYSEYIK